jgi:vacuolar-type H+-ATPase subunit I/STV1
MTEADIVLQQMIYALGAICVGLTVVFGTWYVRNTSEGRIVVVMWLLSYVGVVLLTTEHIVSHLQEGTSPVWQLWSAFGFFGLGVTALIILLTRRAKMVSRDPGRLP